ncbi:RxLR effector protein [Phytophthora megakarya]|uniref:RxLR effector protein n=1 Tax=Phytophthora megakarya TaxID=4795 RepID=A0A225WWE2_9STRA|nr:RxLR effector protein [Phytophthora megakarya]
MYILNIVFLVVSAYFGGVNAATSSLAFIGSSVSTVEGQDNFDSGRVLRSDNGIDVENEERYPPISKIETFKSWFTPATISDDMINSWVKEKKSADDAFVRLKLRTRRAEKLLENPKFMTWIYYVKVLNAETGGPSYLAIWRLTKYYDDDVVAKLIIAAKKNPEMEKIAIDLQTQQFQYWFNRYITHRPDDVFISLKLAFAKDKLLEDPLFFTWINYVKYYNENAKNAKRQQATFLETLGSKWQYTDDEISVMIAAALKAPTLTSKNPGSEIIANQVETALITLWLTKYNPNQVFRILRLHRSPDTLLENPLLRTWTKYVNAFNAKTPEKQLTTLDILRTQFGDERLSKMLVNAKTVPSAKNLAAKKEDVDKVLQNPHFPTWVKYAKALRDDNGAPSWLAVSKLTEYYDDAFVARLIEGAKQKPGMEKMASDLQTQQFHYWVGRHRIGTSDAVFTALGLTRAEDKLLEHPLFFTWMKFVKFYNENTKTQQVGFLSVLGRKFRYSDHEISQMVTAAKKAPSTLYFANKLRAEQVERWFSKGESPSKIWQSLKFDIAGDNILASPEFRTLVTYVERFNKKYPNKKTSLVSVLNLYNRKASTQAIIAALKNKKPGSEKLAKQVETALIKVWLPKYSPGQVFRILKLHRSPNKLLEKTLLYTWTKYMETFNVMNPKKRTTMIDTLRIQFGDKILSDMLVKAKTIPSTKDLSTKLENELLIKLAAEGKAVEAPIRVA